MSEQTYIVTGMTCDHCVRAVTDEVSKVAGITSVDVDLSTGRLTVRSEDQVDDAAVATAVDEAGYAVTL